ncbi:MAG: hypothetical protein JWM57_2707, partial [Phycisphaerales bacterium]|nr:hypothetical protein [Phycisphaerales bacterium]
MLNDPLRPPNSSARLAGLLFIILGSLALFAGLSFLAYGAAVPTLQNDPVMKQQLEDLRRQTTVDLQLSDLQVIAYVAGALFAAYGLAAIVVGLFIRASNRVASILGIVLAGGVVLLLGLCSLSLLLKGGAIPQFVVVMGLM